MIHTNLKERKDSVKTIKNEKINFAIKPKHNFISDTNVSTSKLLSPTLDYKKSDN